uniref:Uncharacterized protein n=1 Tax=Rhizophora mucronata TaxID=61149 RepID=A0A2P2QA33_RHIMU
MHQHALLINPKITKNQAKITTTRTSKSLVNDKHNQVVKQH